MTQQDQPVYFRMDNGYRNSPEFASATKPTPARVQVALEDYANKLIEKLTKFAVEKGYSEDSVTCTSRRINIVSVNMSSSLVEELFALDVSQRKRLFPSISAIIPKDDIDRPAFGIS